MKCQPPESTEAETVHLLNNGDDDIPWTWTGDGWRCVSNGKSFDPDDMARLGWVYRRPD